MNIWDRKEINSKKQVELCLHAMNSKLANCTVRYYAIIFFNDSVNGSVAQRHIYTDTRAEAVTWLDYVVSIYDTANVAYKAYLNGEQYCTKGTLKYKRYDYCIGQKYDYLGNVYECVVSNYTMDDGNVVVCLQNVNDDEYIFINVDEWLDFHHKYLIKEKENKD